MLRKSFVQNAVPLQFFSPQYKVSDNPSSIPLLDSLWYNWCIIQKFSNSRNSQFGHLEQIKIVSFLPLFLVFDHSAPFVFLLQVDSATGLLYFERTALPTHLYFEIFFLDDLRVNPYTKVMSSNRGNNIWYANNSKRIGASQKIYVKSIYSPLCKKQASLGNFVRTCEVGKGKNFVKSRKIRVINFVVVYISVK